MGSISLGMSSNDVIRILGKPQVQIISNGLGSPLWRYTNGLEISLRYGTAIATGPVWKIAGKLPFQGATSEGFHLGDSLTTLQKIYHRFSIMKFASNQAQIGNVPDIVLNVQFDANEKAIFIVVTDTSCPGCTPVTGTPIGGKHP